MKRLPLGIQTFSSMIEENHYYVDKTEFIYKLANIGKYFFLSRPRRFGKSSFLDTLQEAYKGNGKLFKGLFLENNWDWSKKHPVIRISFGGGQTRSVEELSLMIHDMFLAFERQFQLELKSVSISGKFKELIEKLYEQTGSKIVILIDEYDKPILDTIEQNSIAYKVRDELKNLYSVIKDSDRYIQFVFITGVSKLPPFISPLIGGIMGGSGLNNLMDITLMPDFSSICGYTQTELLTVFQERLHDVPLDTVKEWYNGYNFLGESVYNPYDILLYLQNKDFQNYWFQTGTPSFLIKLMEQRNYNVPDIENVYLSEKSMDSFDIGSIELETLLFQTGYLTIRERYKFGQKYGYILEYPNLEVKKSLTDYVLDYLSNEIVHKEKTQYELFLMLEKNNIEGLRKIFHSFFASIPYNWYTKNDMANYEGYYSSIFYCYFTAIGLEVIPEDATNHGRIDMTVIYKGRCYIFEFKVNELTPDGRAIEQLREKKYHEKYVGYKSTHIDSGTIEEIYLIGAEFSKKDRNITRFEWEKVNYIVDEIILNT